MDMRGAFEHSRNQIIRDASYSLAEDDAPAEKDCEVCGQRLRLGRFINRDLWWEADITDRQVAHTLDRCQPDD